MEINNILYVKDRRAWRAWLSKNHKKEKNVWLIYYKKASGKKTIPYNDAVDEALCYGWIDSTRKNLDEDRYTQRFTPRNPKSSVSQMNKERIWMLIDQGRMTKAGLDAIAKVFDHRSNPKDFVFPKDIMDAIKENKKAWSNFKKFPERYKRIRVAYVERRRSQGKDVFENSLKNLIKKTEENKRFGLIQE